MEAERSPPDELHTVAVILWNRYRRDECTILTDTRYHSEVPHSEWISAKEGSYISLDSAR